MTKIFFVQFETLDVSALFELQHVISNNVAMVKSKNSNQTSHKCSLIRALACHINDLWN